MFKVMLVDDDPTFALLMQDLLTARGYRVECSFDGSSALCALGTDESPRDIDSLPSIIVLDCMMPRLDGFSVARKLAYDDAARHIPIIVLTTRSRLEESFRELPNVVEYVVKPPDPELLLELIDKHTAARTRGGMKGHCETPYALLPSGDGAPGVEEISMRAERITGIMLALALLGGSTPFQLRAASIDVVPESAGNPSAGMSVGGAAGTTRIDALDLQPLLSHLSLPQLNALHSEPLTTQPLVAQLMALQVQPIAALERFKASDNPDNRALHRILSHPDVIAEQHDALIPMIGKENFQTLLTTARELNKLAAHNVAVRAALRNDATPAEALQRFREQFDGAGAAIPGPVDGSVVSGVEAGLKSRPSGLKQFEPRPTTALAGIPTPAATPAVPWGFLDDASVLAAFNEKVVGMAATFQNVPKGNFLMGSDAANDKDRLGDETRHEVNIDYGYSMQTTPLTWGQLLRIVDLSTTKIEIPDFARDPRNNDGGKRETLQGIAINSDHPAVNISWDDAQRLIEHVNEVFARNGLQWIIRLPSESEWEKAARAGSDGPYPVKAGPFGTIAKALQKIAWFLDNAGNRTHAVGQMPANKFGLRDMFGNVREWTQDKYANYKEAPTNGGAQENTGTYRVARGGSWSRRAGFLRPAYRDYGAPGYRWTDEGLRLVRSSR